MRLIELSDLIIPSSQEIPGAKELDLIKFIPKNVEETKTIIQPWIAENKLRKIKNYTFAIENRLNREFIGLFGLKLGKEKYKRGEVWYKIHSDYWKKGYATESL